VVVFQLWYFSFHAKLMILISYLTLCGRISLGMVLLDSPNCFAQCVNFLFIYYNLFLNYLLYCVGYYLIFERTDLWFWSYCILFIINLLTDVQIWKSYFEVFLWILSKNFMIIIYIHGDVQFLIKIVLLKNTIKLTWP